MRTKYLTLLLWFCFHCNSIPAPVFHFKKADRLLLIQANNCYAKHWSNADKIIELN